MRVVQLIPSLSVGGAERVAALLARAHRADGDAVAVVALGAAAGSWIEAELEQDGVEVHALGKGPGLEPAVVGRLAARLRALRPDVVHTHLHVLKYLLPALVGLRPRPVVVHTLHNLAHEEAVAADQLVQRLCFGHGVHPVAIGVAVAQSAAALYGQQPAALIPNGVPVGAFADARAQHRVRARAELGLADGEVLVFTAGRLNAQKNHALLLQAFADPRLGGATLCVAGDGELRPALEAQAAALSGRARLLGVRRDVPALLGAADVFALSSDYEGNPLVVMEAMAAGLPVVSTAVGCVPELVVPGTGLLVDPGQPGALADALAALAADPDRRRAMGEAAKARAARAFDVGLMARRYRALYSTLRRGPGR